ncbi:hypothetical protein LTR10_008416 [Elasticomyces elasticus]|nr:hypothetical protein LTR10_008416 [Elasticomyces elasticus]KAK4967289.1 hypothetical protein LTR42_010638 [Elasticomyces elasticus]
MLEDRKFQWADVPEYINSGPQRYLRLYFQRVGTNGGRSHLPYPLGTEISGSVIHNAEKSADLIGLLIVLRRPWRLRTAMISLADGKREAFYLRHDAAVAGKLAICMPCGSGGGFVIQDFSGAGFKTLRVPDVHAGKDCTIRCYIDRAQDEYSPTSARAEIRRENKALLGHHKSSRRCSTFLRFTWNLLRPEIHLLTNIT